MLRSFFEKISRGIITLRFSILSIFVSLFVTAILLLISINYVHSSATLLYTANNLMNDASSSIYEEFNDEVIKAERDNVFTVGLIHDGILNPDDITAMAQYTYELANQFNIVESAYWGDEKGNLIKARYEPNDSITSEVINRNKIPATRKFIYRNLAGAISKREPSTDLSYDPRQRPWYIQAKDAKQKIWTDVYLYLYQENKKYLGITVATPVFKKDGGLRGIFGLDIRLDWLSWYVGKQKVSPNALIFIVNTKGQLIAFPKLYEEKEFSHLVDIHAINIPWLGLSFDLYQQHPQKAFTFQYQSKTYIANFRAAPKLSENGWLIGVVAPQDDFIGNLKKTNMIDAGIGIAILAFGILIVSGLVTRVVRPIKNLAKQTEKIKNFELDNNGHIKSRIKEVAMLSDAIYSMRLGLKSFQKYVPASLVRQLIEAGQDAVIGGTKKPLALFFSDIENFTTIAENMEPNSLMEHTCEYFNAVSKILTAEHATIDKYIGDSIMAFWGAPFPTDYPCHRAARSALACVKRLNELNNRWREEGKTPFFTRIGLHSGDAIVGNVGSEERINYTALGDAINVASRLEGINKIYHSHIIVSDTMYNEIKNDFVLRKIDEVAIKGKKASRVIYELLAITKDELTFDIDKYREIFDKAFVAYQRQRWDEAIQLLRECLVIFPADYLAPVFIMRCENYKTHPPAQWDGVWRA